MCGIAGIIHRGKSNNVGGEMQKMLQSLKHRGPDSTGYALYGEGESNNYILRFKVGENVKEGTTAVKEDPAIYAIRRKEVDKKINEVGATIHDDKKIMQVFASGTSGKTEWFYDIPSKCTMFAII